MITARFCLCVAAIISVTLLLIYICINEIETEDHTGPPVEFKVILCYAKTCPKELQK